MLNSQIRRTIVSLGFIIAPLILITALLSIPAVVAAQAPDQVILDWQTDAQGNALLPGQVIDDEFHSNTGISITLRAESARANGSNVRAIFPSHNPPTDFDLGTPNETCPGGGPGIGDGGEVGQPGENCIPQENILIIPTVGDDDGDGFIDGDPDDDARGGLAIFLFSAPVTIDYLEIIDQEDGETADIRTYTNVNGDPGSLITEVPTMPLGDNSYQRINLAVQGVRRLEVEYEGSGGLASMAYTPDTPTAVSLSTLNASITYANIAPFLVAFFLLVASTVAVAWIRRSPRT